MYTGNAARIYNPRPDPVERGPPKRVARDETHIGEMVAASKKRISWKFALGEADAVHEVVLVHSIMSYKKVIEFDGRQMHYSATFTPGDWKFLMILEGSNHAFEVRINDLESEDVPKYDLAVDRIPFRHWDVYRRRKQPITTATYALPNAPQPTNTFGTQRWGPSGMSAPPPPPPPEPAANRYGQYANSGASAAHATREGRVPSSGASRDSGGNRGSFTGESRGSFSGESRDSFTGGNRSSLTGSPPYPQQQQQPPLRQQRHSGSAAAPTKQPEINLIDDFGPSVSVSAQTLLFDPLVGTNFGAPAQTSANPPPAQQQQPNARTASSPAFAPPHNAPIQPTPAPYVDPFASVAQAAPLKPTTVSLSAFAAPSGPYPTQQQQQQRPSQPPGAFYPNAAAFQSQPMLAQNLGGVPVAPIGAQQAVVMSWMGAPQPVNNISQLMNPADVNGAQQQRPQTKSINIDAFAGMS